MMTIFCGILICLPGLLYSADNQQEARKKIQYQLEHVPKIVYGHISVANHGNEPLTVSVEGINFVDIKPKDTAQSPVVLTFKKLTDEVVIKSQNDHTFKYFYNVHQNSLEPEFLLMYPRLCIKYETDVGYQRFPTDRTPNSIPQLQFDCDKFFTSKLVLTYKGFGSKRIPCSCMDYQSNPMRLLHLQLLTAGAQCMYNQRFIQQCQKHLEGDIEGEYIFLEASHSISMHGEEDSYQKIYLDS